MKPPTLAHARPLNRVRGRVSFVLLVSIAIALTSGCTGPQSSLDPAGRAAERIAELFWWMAGGAFAIWIAMIWLTVSAIRGRVGKNTDRQARLYVIGGGAILPTVVLTALLVYGLGLMPELLAPAPAGSLKITVTGEQWWWRVRYHEADGGHVELANEIRLPVGEPVEFELESPDVIHSFWIPSLGGKMDMIPGRRTRLVLHPTRTGTFRGQCAEYCGASHALMAFPVVVMERPAFDAWLEAQRQPAAQPAAPLAAEGGQLFFANGCSACHTIRGTDAHSSIGPDLTHVGGRLTLGAGIVGNDTNGFLRWLERTEEIKPGVHMPHFGMLPAGELNALAAYLESLQ
jgi:cytochrome c oxidase subunit 2